jgi:hypothetical protein
MATINQGMISPGDQVGGVTVFSGVVEHALSKQRNGNHAVGTVNEYITTIHCEGVNRCRRR